MTYEKSAELNLPPVYDAVVLADGAENPRNHACRLADAGAEAGLFVWRPSGERIECALVLRPDETVAQILPVALVASVALLDALGAAGPPAVACDLVWPATVRINGGVAGGVALDIAPGERPEWAVVSAALCKMGEAEFEAGDRPDRTSLADEGFGDMADHQLIEAYARYFLVWMDRWEDSGLGAIVPHWLQRARSQGPDTVIFLGDELIAGTIEDLDEAGALVLACASGNRALRLTPELLAGLPGGG